MNDEYKFLVVGLTGPTGSGKTTVSEVFADNGFYVINCDSVAHEVTQKSTPCLKELVHEFSNDILNEDGTLNRQKLADIVFSDSVKKACFEGVVYPYIIAKILDEIKNAASNGVEYVLLDAPTLFQSNADDLCDVKVSVIADEHRRYENVISRDGLSLKQAQLRMSAQKKDDYYITRSDVVIRNNKDIDTLKRTAKELVNTIKEFRHV